MCCYVFPWTELSAYGLLKLLYTLSSLISPVIYPINLPFSFSVIRKYFSSLAQANRSDVSITLATIYFFQIHIENFLHHSIISCNSKNSCCDSGVNPVLKTIKFKIYRWWHKWNTYSLLIWRIHLQRTDTDKNVNIEKSGIEYFKSLLCIFFTVTDAYCIANLFSKTYFKKRFDHSYWNINYFINTAQTEFRKDLFSCKYF